MILIEQNVTHFVNKTPLESDDMNDKCFEMTQGTPAGRHGGRLLENLFQSKHLKRKKIGIKNIS